MAKDENNNMQFLFGDRELILMVADLLSAPVDVIVNPANGGLSHGGGVAGQIVQQGGELIQQESDLFIKEHGMLESGMVAFTHAGALPYQAILHAVGPTMGEGDEQQKIQLAVSRSLQLCDMHSWKSIAFPAISTGIFAVPIAIAATAMFRAITSFWDARIDSYPEKVIICLTKDKFEAFFHAFQSTARSDDDVLEQAAASKLKENENNIEPDLEVGIVDLSEEAIVSLNNDKDIDDWFN